MQLENKIENTNLYIVLQNSRKSFYSEGFGTSSVLYNNLVVRRNGLMYVDVLHLKAMTTLFNVTILS